MKLGTLALKYPAKQAAMVSSTYAASLLLNGRCILTFIRQPSLGHPFAKKVVLVRQRKFAEITGYMLTNLQNIRRRL
jgi:hypothetical protein